MLLWTLVYKYQFEFNWTLAKVLNKWGLLLTKLENIGGKKNFSWEVSGWILDMIHFRSFGKSVRKQLEMWWRDQFSSVTQSCPTLCDPMNCSTPGLPVHHELLEFTQTHAHRFGDAIQPSHPLLSPSPPAPNPSHHQDLFQWVNSSHEVAKVLEFQLHHQSFQWTPRIDLL